MQAATHHQELPERRDITRVTNPRSATFNAEMAARQIWEIASIAGRTQSWGGVRDYGLRYMAGEPEHGRKTREVLRHLANTLLQCAAAAVESAEREVSAVRGLVVERAIVLVAELDRGHDHEHTKGQVRALVARLACSEENLWRAKAKLEEIRAEMGR